jgi:hypothetical protein
MTFDSSKPLTQIGRGTKVHFLRPVLLHDGAATHHKLHDSALYLASPFCQLSC